MAIYLTYSFKNENYAKVVPNGAAFRRIRNLKFDTQPTFTDDNIFTIIVPN